MGGQSLLMVQRPVVSAAASKGSYIEHARNNDTSPHACVTTGWTLHWKFPPNHVSNGLSSIRFSPRLWCGARPQRWAWGHMRACVGFDVSFLETSFLRLL